MNEHMERTVIRDIANKVGETVLVQGWVQVRRDHGKLIFIDVRDRSGILQVVFHPKVSEAAHTLATTLKNEDVVYYITLYNENYKMPALHIIPNTAVIFIC